MEDIDMHSEIIDSFCERFTQADSDAFADLFTENAVYFDSLYGKYKGRQAISDFHHRCQQEATNYRFLPKSYLADNNKMAAFEWQLTFISMMPLSKNKEITVEGSAFMTLTEGKIISYKEYTDSIAILLKGNVPDEKIMKFYHRKYE